MRKLSARAAVAAFLATLFLGGTLLLTLPRPAFSDLENRPLPRPPALTWERWLNGAFADAAETFVSDHFPWRAHWLSVKSVTEQLRLAQEHNGIYKGRDGYLLPRLDAPDEDTAAAQLAAIARFQQRHPGKRLQLMLIPSVTDVFPERLPYRAPTASHRPVHEAATATDIPFLDGFAILPADAPEQLYYRTDHHWTTHGAYRAYAAYATASGWQPLATEAFDVVEVSGDFLGSYHTRSLFAGVKPEPMHAYIPCEAPPVLMYIADDDEIRTTMYAPDRLGTKDKYSYFLDGVHALVRLQTNAEPFAGAPAKLLVIKDSFAHSFVPFLTPHIPDIHVMDLRYYNGSVDDYMTEHGIDDVLLLFSTNTLLELTALQRLGR